MISYIIIITIFFLVAVTMTMVGKGGGNFYVLILALANIPMHEAAATGQFVLFAASIAAMIIFQKNKAVIWPLAFFIGAFVSISALTGGYFSHYFSGFWLKIIFSFLLFISGIVMLFPVSENVDIKNSENKIGYWKIKVEDENYIINLWIVVPVTLLVGFTSGMVGVSGGSFLVPLMVLACTIPMHAAVGTASSLIAVTALMGFIGHAAQGDFNPHYALPLAVVTIIGGILGGKFALKTKPKNLKRIFAYTNWLAAVFMITNAFLSL